MSKDIDHLTKPWLLSPKRNYAFLNANLIDVVAGTIIENVTIYINNGIISQVDTVKKEVPEGFNAVNLEGQFVCPGLIDVHIHLVAVPGGTDLKTGLQLPLPRIVLQYHRLCKNMLDRGFTSVRDCGGAAAFVRDAIEDDIIHGPRLFLAGNALSQTGGHGDLRNPVFEDKVQDACGCQSNVVARICDGADECLKAARDELRKGADFIKIMAGGGVASPTDNISSLQFTSEEIKAIVQAASNSGTYVTAHAYTPQSIRHCIENGVRGIEHGNLIDESTAEYMASHDAYLTPTLITYKMMANDQFTGFLPEEVRKKNEKVLAAGLKSLAIAKNAGVKICYGSDLLGPLVSAQTGEFVLRSSVCTPAEILQAATINPAKLLGMESKLGQLKQGFYADLLILNSNPLEDISVLDRPDRHLLAVMKGGRIYKSRWTKLPDDVIQRDIIE
ncbi:amidohydrolase [Schizosaccharomyces cryophilus OY26]|uniref:Amidohydrolase n=1 Tax=Schizosaccharomyces cryophilus (strain OY26 / ATCC MYA-4695 / CBS 11777 / NBRC 106824 / NRRL Y48691) TaxID=653667 RepID=S9VSN8_SCHCR|nr:amidohydrolase [Schizosaccharomyces cryophilus OY26]EPY49150.1 amidohydrolase [Schizosaccharomyces cryophilus OY26]